MFTSNWHWIEICENVVSRERSFNMTRGGGDKDIEGGSKNLYTSKPTGDNDETMILYQWNELQ